MTAIAKLRVLRGLLASFRFNYSSEFELQDGIDKVLKSRGYRLEREFRVTLLSRLDFLVDGDIAIETKIGGSANQLMRQVAKYAESPDIAGILVVTDRASHSLPESFNGKPLLLLSLLDGAL